LTPLLDVILNLIFFFILATTIQETKEFLDVQLPSSSEAAERAEVPKTLIITVTEENKVFLGEEEIEAERLHERIEGMKAEEIKEIIIRGDAKAYNQTMVKVLDECAKAGKYGVSIEVIKRAEVP
jgi:biopolymer transport protein ExbD